MAKKNNKQNPAKKNEVKTDLKEQKPVAAVANPAPEKKEKEVKQDPPKEDPTGTVETTVVEEVQEQKKAPEGSSLVPPKVDSLITLMQPTDMMDANHAAIFMDTMERRLSKMKPNEPLTIKMESMLDYNMLWYAVKLSVQSYAQKRDMNMLTPNDETIVQSAIDMAASMGIALEAHPTKDGQMALEFKNIPEDVKEAAQAENEAQAQQKKGKREPLSEEQMNPLNWKTDEEAIKALMQDIRATNESPSNKFLRLLGKVKTYRQNVETDPVKKNLWNTCKIGDLTEEFIKLVGKKGIIVLNGLISGTVASMRCGQTMIFAHSTVKKNMPALSDEEIADLVKTFIKIQHEGSDKPLDQDAAVVKGILEPTRDLFVRIALLKPSEDHKTDLDWYKKVLNPFFNSYKEEVGSRVTTDGADNPDFPLKAANKMIEIRNLYVDKDAVFPLFTKADFDAVLGKL